MRFLIILMVGFLIMVSDQNARAKENASLPDIRVLNTGNNEELRVFLNNIFAPGTDRAFVEKMLIDVAGAQKVKEFDLVKTYEGYITYDFDTEKYKESAVYYYKRPFIYRVMHLFLTDGAYVIAVNYDKNNRVIGRITLSGPTGL